MATRSRTLLFIQYRNTYSRNPKSRFDNSENASLIPNKNDIVVEMSILPPKWVDIVDEIEEDIVNIKEKIVRIESLYKKHVLPGFDDRLNDEQSIEKLADEIIRMFQQSQFKIKRIYDEKSYSRSVQTQALGKNIQTSLATKLSDLSTTFRKTQSAYLSKLRGREANRKDGGFVPHADDDELDSVFTDVQMAVVESNEKAISEREREINEIVKSINGLATVFKELNAMVIDQGSILDRIDYNMEATNVNLEQGHEELKKAEKYQKSGAAKVIIIVLLLIVILLICFVLYKMTVHRPK